MSDPKARENQDSRAETVMPDDRNSQAETIAYNDRDSQAETVAYSETAPGRDGPVTSPGGKAPIFEIGSTIAGRYEVLALLGAGGMGAVYKMHDRELDRTVALKVIRPELAYSTGMSQRFKQEIILARDVTHRNIVRMYDLGKSEETAFVTMEFVEGETLTELLKRRGKLPVDEAVAIIRQVCEG
ncbi:MAG: serine/threonine-protein kinase, partial [Acidobacteriota bacterium]